MRRKPRPLSVTQLDALFILNTVRPYGQAQPFVGRRSAGTEMSAWLRTMKSLAALEFVKMDKGDDGTFRAHITHQGIDKVLEFATTPPTEAEKAYGAARGGGKNPTPEQIVAEYQKSMLEAAAPELLAALVEMVEAAEEVGQKGRPMVVAARAAIAKAEGDI